MSNDECRMSKHDGRLSEPIRVSSFLRSFVIRASSFYFVPDPIQFFEPDLAQLLPASTQFVFDAIKPRHEFVCGRLERFLGIKSAFPCEIYDGKKKIDLAQLLPAS